MHIRKPLAVTAALVTALSFTAAPAYAQGISVKKAGQQFKADVVAFVRSFSHVDSQLQTLQKNHRDSQAQVFPLYELLIGPTVRLGHELRTRRSPNRYLADIVSFETYTTALRVDLLQINHVDPFTWQQNFNIDFNSWQTSGEAVQEDLNVTLPNS